MPVPDFRALFHAAPGLYLVLLPDAPHFTIMDASDAYLRATMTTRDAICGRGLFEVFPDHPNDAGATGMRKLRASLERVVRSGACDTMAGLRYGVRRPAGRCGELEAPYWSTVNTPVFGDNGELTYIIHCVEDVTDFIRLQQADRARDIATQELRVDAESMRDEILMRGQELQLSNERLQSERAATAGLAAELTGVIDSIPDPVYVATRERITRCNRPALDMLGLQHPAELDKSAIVFKEQLNVRDPERGSVVPAHEQPLARALSGNIVVRDVLVRHAKFGRDLVMRCAAAPVWQDGRVVAAVVTNTDVTERRQLLTAEARARAEAEAAGERLRRLHAIADVALAELPLEALLDQLVTRIQALLEGDTATILLLDQSRQLLEVRASKGLEEEVQEHVTIPVGAGIAGRLAVNREPLVIEDLAAVEVVSPALRKHLRALVGVPLVVENRVLGVLYVGSRRPRHFTNDDVMLLRLAAERAAAAIERIQLHRAAQEELAQRERLRRHNDLLLASAGEGIFGVDAHGNVTFVNPAGADALGYTDTELVGQPIHSLIHHSRSDGSPYPREACAIQAALSDGVVRRVSDEVFWCKDGRGIPVEYTSTPIREGGSVVGAVVTFRDISDRKEADRQRAALARSEQLRALGQMASGIAHDINQTLALITGYGALARQALELTPPKLGNADEFLRVVFQAAHEAGDTVKRLLTFARERPQGNAEPVDLGQVLGEVAHFTAPRWRDAAQAEGRPIELTVQADKGLLVEGWPHALREALTNLVFNAVDAMPDGGSIRLTARPGGDRVLMEVADTGTGMPHEVRERIFEPFFTTKGERGTGLGLAQVFAIVEQHGGEITVESEPGQGTQFHISFPRSSMASESSATAEPMKTVGGATGLRVLAVDDQPALARLAALSLQREGHTVGVATSAEEGLEYLEQSAVDVVVSDLSLGAGMNGWEFAAEVKRRWPAIRFILATGWGAAIQDDERRERGVDAVIAKPYHIGDLRRLLTEEAS